MRRRLLASLIGVLVVAFGSLLGTVIAGNTPNLGLDLQGGASVTLTPVGDYDPAALDEIPNIYRSRIDSLGVAEPEISRQGNTVVVNLPGVDDTDRALSLIQTTGKVLFRPVVASIPTAAPIDFSQIGVNPISLASELDAATSTSVVTIGDDGLEVSEVSAAPADTTSESVAADGSVPDTTTAATDTSGGVSRAPHRTPTTTVAETASTETASATTEASSSATTEASSADSSVASDASAASDTTVAGETTTTAGGPTTTVAAIPIESYITPDDQDLPESEVFLPDRVGSPILYQLGPAFARGELAIDSAAAAVVNGQWVVDLTLQGGPDGLDKWNEWAAKCYSAAAECAGQGMAIVIDHRVISAPVPQQPSFASTQIQVTGNFTESEATDLARVLNYGATPVEMKAESAQTVSATLGKDSLNAGLISGAIGVGLVVLFMLLYYRSLAGILLLGLCVSGSLIWSVVSLLSKTSGLSLTLAGVTGIIVSVGVTVDSYVVFFERLKDEVRSGKSFRASAARGFTGAWRTILAADIVSLIGAIVLWRLSVGAVRGFAFFLGLSTLCDLVVAWFFTRPAVLLLSRSKLFQGGRLLGVDAASTKTAGVAR